MNTWRTLVNLCCWSFVIISLTVVSGCGYAWRTQKPIHNERSNIDAPVSTMTLPDRVNSENILFKHLGSQGEIIVTITSRKELYDLKTDTVDRQIYQKSGYGKQHKQWPIWVDAITAPVLAIGGGTALALGASQDTENDIEYRDNPDTGEREQKESPNSSDQDYFYVAGGIGIGLSIPFAISAIHNGVKTKDRNIGAPVRTNLETKINMRTTTTPLTGTPVEIKLPDGTEIAATSDDKGRVVIDLPNNKTAFFPFQYMVQIIVPSKEARYDIPANEKSLALLPPMAMARADELAERLRQSKKEYARLNAAYQDATSTRLFAGNWYHEKRAKDIPSVTVRTELTLFPNGSYRFSIERLRNGYLVPGAFGIKSFVTNDRWEVASENSIVCFDRESRVEPQALWTFRGGKLTSPGFRLASKNAIIAKRRGKRKVVSAADVERAKSNYESALQEYSRQLPTNPYQLNK